MSVSNASRLIPEQRIVDVWNAYVREIGAPEEAIVTVVEIYNRRDAEFVVAQRIWARGIQTVWTMPRYSQLAQWQVAEGCRAIETVRVIHDLDLFQNVRIARDRVKKGIVRPDEIRNHVVGVNSRLQTASRLEGHSNNNPVRLANSDIHRSTDCGLTNNCSNDCVTNYLYPREPR